MKPIKTKKAARPNPFKGAKDVYLTKNKIAVVRVESKRSERGYEQTKKVKYYARNDSNLKPYTAPRLPSDRAATGIKTYNVISAQRGMVF